MIQNDNDELGQTYHIENMVNETEFKCIECNKIIPLKLESKQYKYVCKSCARK